MCAHTGWSAQRFTHLKLVCTAVILALRYRTRYFYFDLIPKLVEAAADTGDEQFLRRALELVNAAANQVDNFVLKANNYDYLVTPAQQETNLMPGLVALPMSVRTVRVNYGGGGSLLLSVEALLSAGTTT